MNAPRAIRASKLVRAAAVLLAAGAAGAHAAKSSVSYVADFSSDAAWLVDWDTTHATAHVTLGNGASGGAYVDDGTQRLVTLATPIAESGPMSDPCEANFTQTITLDQLVFRPTGGTARRGTAQVVSIGTITNSGGCSPGTTSYGSPTDAGVATTLLDMTLRPSTADLDGARLAGMSSQSLAGLDYAFQVPAQVASFDATAAFARFDGSTAEVPVSHSSGWLVLSFFGSTPYQNAYTRLSRNATTGVESWLAADWQAGAPARVHHVLMTQPNAAAGFGTHNQAAHDWNSGLFLTSSVPTEFDLYRDSTGAFIEHFVDDGTTFTQPATWALAGANLVIKRSNDFSAGWRQRTWVPLANVGKNHFVMENEDLFAPDGTRLGTNFPARVNWYVDEGKSTEPPAAEAPVARTVVHAGMQP